MYYPLGLHLQPCFAPESGAEPDILPETESATRESVAIPVHAELSKEQLDHVFQDDSSDTGNPDIVVGYLGAIAW